MNPSVLQDLIAQYPDVTAEKTARPAWKLFTLGALAGFLIGMSSAAAAAASHAIANPSAARLIAGLIFPFGLGIVLMLGAELFTGNCMMPAALPSRQVTVWQVLRHWLWVYLGNFAGGAALAAACVFAGPLDHGGGSLAIHTIRAAAHKCALPFGSAVVLGILCNLLVCTGVLCGSGSKTTAGRVLGAYLPVAFFVLAGFEHSVANMFIIPAGLLARLVPDYEALAQGAGVDVSALTWGRFLAGNLLPVTLGNAVGGAGLMFMLWGVYKTKK